MSIICKLFGHRPQFGWGNSEGHGYFRVVNYHSDGINTHHAYLICDCERCGVNYQVGKIHIPQKYVDALTELEKFKKH